MSEPADEKDGGSQSGEEGHPSPASSRVEPGTAEKQIAGDVAPALTQAEFEAQRRAQRIQAARQKLANRRRVANGALVLMALQIVIVDLLVTLIAKHHDWSLNDGVFKTWLWATVVQVISIVLVITRYLFPKGAPDDLSMSEYGSDTPSGTSG
ncbi:hypothetical protein ACVU7I_03195 [Patulibacter sp. S7RM1-6]